MSIWSYRATPELTDEQYARWQSLLEQRTGICFLQHKSILQKGLSQRMREVGAENYESYFDHVSAVPEGAVEWARLVDRIAVKETSFFREPHSFVALKRFLLERISESAQAADFSLDLWSLGCSTGEEAYSLAMAAGDIIDYAQASAFVGVFAMDISQSALATARRGVYAARKVESLPMATRKRYFLQLDDGQFEIRPEIKRRLCFAQGNILQLDRAPQGLMDVIFCQNVLVYFRQEKKHRVLNELVEHLKPGGMLMLGPGEVAGWSHPLLRRMAEEKVQAYIKAEVIN